MRLHPIKLIHHWRSVILLAMMPALLNCSRIEGSVALANSNGVLYSFNGAIVEVFDLNRASVVSGESKTRKGLGSVTNDNGGIVLHVIVGTIYNDALYDVEIHCPTNNTTDACNVESPLHGVLTGAQLKADGWNVTALTEMAFQSVAYHVAVDYTADEIRQVLDNTANALLGTAPPNPPKTYNDVLTWHPGQLDTVKRPGLLNAVSESLANGVDNNEAKLLAWQAINPYITTLDLSAQWTGESFIRHVTIANGYAYLAGNCAGLGIVDISNPEHPVPVGHSWEISPTTPVVVSGNFAYAVGEQGLQVVDVSNPQQPLLMGQLAVTGIIRHIEKAGTHAYIATTDALSIINVSNPATPILVTTLPGPAYTLAVHDTTAYITNDNGLQIIDVSNPVTPAVIGNMELSFFTTAIAASADHVYLIADSEPFSGPGGLRIINVETPTAPYQTGELTLTPDGREITLSEARVYVTSVDTVHVIDVSNVASPVLVEKLGIPRDGFGPSSVALSSEFAYISNGQRQLFVADLSLTGRPTVQSGSLALVDGAPGRISSTGHYAYLQNTNPWDEQRGFAIFDLINPVAPIWINDFDEVDYLSSVVAIDNYAFMGDAAYGALHVVDISNPLQPFMLDASVYLDDGPLVEELPGLRGIILTNDVIYMPWGHRAYDDGSGVGYGEWGCTHPDVNGGVGGLFAINVSAPDAPVMMSHICMPDQANAVAATETHAYVAVADGQLQVVDFSDPSQPALAGSVPLSGSANFVAANDNYVWTAQGANGIDIVDVSNATAPVVVTNINTSGYVTSIAFDEHHAYIADGPSGILVFDVTHPAAPRLIGGTTTRGSAFSVFLAGDYIEVATGYGLEVFRKMPALN